MRIVTILVLLVVFGGLVSAQSRSGWTAGTDNPTGISYPCLGTPIYSEDFEMGIPMATWSIWDFDSLTPHPSTGLQPGWQAITDYRDSTNGAAASPSWYLPVGQSDDWLITPGIALGSNTCFSWKVYSQDPLYPEDYSVLISTTLDTAGFLSNPALFATSSENGDVKFRSVMLDNYANQTVFIAFRQTSDDEFVLVIDEVTFTEVENVDAGAFSVDTVAAQALAPEALSGTFFNYGADTLESVDLNWREGSGPVHTMSFDSLGLPPNSEYAFIHDSSWTPTGLGTFELCFWTSNPNGTTDQNFANDTVCQTVNVTEFVSVEPERSPLSWDLYPNPGSDFIRIRTEASGALDIQILDLQGREVLRRDIHAGQDVLNVAQLPDGIYMVVARKQGEFAGSRKLMIP